MPKYSKSLIFKGGIMIPVRVSSTITQNKSPVHDVCLECNKGFVGQKRYCKNCNIENTKENIGSGFEIADELKIFSKEQIADIKIESSNLNVQKVIDTENLDLSLRQCEKSYYLYPDKKDSDAKKMYAIVFNALKEAKKSFIVTWKVSSRSSRDSEAVITVNNGILVIRQIAYKEELNEIDEPIDLQVTKEELIQGKGLLNLIPEGTIDDLVDQYQEKLESLLSGKTSKVSVVGKPKENKNLFGLSPDQLKKAEAELQSKAKSVKKAIEETTPEEVDEVLDKDLSETEKAESKKSKKGGKKTK